MPPSWDLDGMYVWLGPTAAASHLDGAWDSTFGGDLAITRVREHELVGAMGVSLGASKWTSHDGGRVWLDAVGGSTILGHMAGVSAGPIVELAQLAHPRLGGSIGVWAFAGVTPFVRVGLVEGLGGFAEIGVHLALPAMRRHVH
jgi:hypothetical protein